jgi:hypothetical protein
VSQAENGGVLNAKEAEILDLLAATRWALRYGTDAAISILRVDSIMCVFAFFGCPSFAVIRVLTQNPSSAA